MQSRQDVDLTINLFMEEGKIGNWEGQRSRSKRRAAAEEKTKPFSTRIHGNRYYLLLLTFNFILLTNAGV